MKKILIIGVAILFIVGVVFFVLYQSGVDSMVVIQNDQEATFLTNDSVIVVQYGIDADTVQVRLDDVQYELNRTETASGTRYQVSDGTIMFWERGGEFMIEIDGEVTVDTATVERRRVAVLKSNEQDDFDAISYGFGIKQNTDEGCDDDTDEYCGTRVVELCDTPDQDCTGGDNVSVIDNDCGSGTVLEDGECVPEKLDDDDDNDSVPAEDDAAATEVSTTTKATDYNSSRSNRTTDN